MDSVRFKCTLNGQSRIIEVPSDQCQIDIVKDTIAREYGCDAGQLTLQSLDEEGRRHPMNHQEHLDEAVAIVRRLHRNFVYVFGNCPSTNDDSVNQTSISTSRKGSSGVLTSSISGSRAGNRAPNVSSNDQNVGNSAPNVLSISTKQASQKLWSDDSDSERGSPDPTEQSTTPSTPHRRPSALTRVLKPPPSVPRFPVYRVDSGIHFDSVRSTGRHSQSKPQTRSSGTPRLPHIRQSKSDTSSDTSSIRADTDRAPDFQPNENTVQIWPPLNFPAITSINPVVANDPWTLYQFQASPALLWPTMMMDSSVPQRPMLPFSSLTPSLAFPPIQMASNGLTGYVNEGFGLDAAMPSTTWNMDPRMALHDAIRIPAQYQWIPEQPALPGRPFIPRHRTSYHNRLNMAV